MVKWIKKLFNIHEHDRKLFCIGDIALVKCTTCGMESMPWQVKPLHAKEWHESHPNAVKEYLEIDKKLEEARK